MRIHVLRPRPALWSFDKGDFERSVQGPILQFQTDSKVFQDVEILHSKLAEDPTYQVKIDCYLAVAALLECKSPLLQQHPAENFVMAVSDAPQFGNLPDILPLIRDCMVHNTWSDTLLGSLLHSVFPCPKPSLKYKQTEGDMSASCILNIVLGLLLGLFPDTSKCPPFPIRVRLYARIHQLLTVFHHEQKHWIQTNSFLCCLALCEYISKAMPLFTPAEHECLVNHFPVSNFFTGTSVFFDGFRQDMLEDGSETWESLNTTAKTIYNRLHRAYKTKCRFRNVLNKRFQMHQRSASLEMTHSDILAQLRKPALVLYPLHFTNPKQLITDFQQLHCDARSVCVCKLVQVAPLPFNIYQDQMYVYSKQAAHCQRQAYMRRNLFLCLFCELQNKASRLRICVNNSETAGLICEHCNSSSCVVSIDTMGRVVRINQKQYLYSSCCGRVVVYSITDDHFPTITSPEMIQNIGLLRLSDALQSDQHSCLHKQLVLKEKKKEKMLCFICGNAALPLPYTFVDLETLENRTVHCCQSHTVPPDLLAHTYNFQEFDKIVCAWETRQHKKKMARLGDKSQ